MDYVDVSLGIYADAVRKLAVRVLVTGLRVGENLYVYVAVNRNVAVRLDSVVGYALEILGSGALED
ncbi:MAG: hypothetical protein J6036_06885 [Clostridia bacterium]|nr:hypothetical protein [Clostridia bacterium]